MLLSGLLVFETASLVGREPAAPKAWRRRAPEPPKRSREKTERLQMRNVRPQEARADLSDVASSQPMPSTCHSGEVGALVNDMPAARHVIGCSQASGIGATAFSGKTI
jgi:hypothetical protein